MSWENMFQTSFLHESSSTGKFARKHKYFEYTIDVSFAPTSHGNGLCIQILILIMDFFYIVKGNSLF